MFSPLVKDGRLPLDISRQMGYGIKLLICDIQSFEEPYQDSLRKKEY